MAITRRGLIGAAALLGAEGVPLLPQGARAAPAADPNIGNIWTSYYAGTRVFAFADRHSVRPGERFSIMGSCAPKLGDRTGTIEVFRLGPYEGADRQRVAVFEKVDVAEEGVGLTASASGVCWPPIIDNVDTSDWRSGYYVFDFIDAKDGTRDLNIAGLVVRAPEADVDILVWISTNTFQAYNKWGGASLYESIVDPGQGGYMVSFDRPTPPDVFEYEYFTILWLERLAAKNNWRLGYASNFDIHREPALVEGCRLLLSGSHNEYWSKEEFDHVYHRIFARGGHTIFFGANTAYWQVRYTDINGPRTATPLGRQMVCFKSVDDPICQRLTAEEAALQKTAMFRDEYRRPETMLAGIAYQNYFAAEGPAKYPYRVARTDLPFFEGTGWKAGDPIGDVVGYEWDNRDPAGDGKRLWDAKQSRIPLLEADRLNVLFTGAPVGIDGKQGLAEAVYFTSPAGAKVFSSGSIRWAWGLGKPGFESAAFRRFNENLFADFLTTRHARG